MPRLSDSEALLGPEIFKKVRETPVLVVGAGGIGCELLKNLVLVGFANIEIIDLDTIDLSNLNRQFLFRKPDISKSKSLVAAQSARHFNPSSGIQIKARHGNVKEAENDIEWISKFGLVMNALDNQDARRHVNRLCQAAGVPLMESGTAGYLGQVTPIVRDVTECFDCVPKPAPKSFPVCTIRATPSEPIHCIVWAKTYLFGKLFGEDDEEVDTAELDKAQEGGENAEEIENLKKEAAAFRQVRKSLGEEDGPRRVFHKVFKDDINRLLAMDDMWLVPGRVKPTALDYDTIMSDEFVAPPLRNVPKTNGAANPPPATNGNSAQLKDQKDLSVKENLELFVDSARRLSARMIAHPDIVLSFDKDDDDTLDFVLATANLRAIAYGIPRKTRFQVKEMAGNIIPAIATTNAIIAGLVVMQATRLLSGKYSSARNANMRASTFKWLESSSLAKPDPKCAVCRDIYVSFKVDPAKVTLGTFIEKAVKEWLPKGLETDDEDEEVEWTVYEGTRILADPDFDDNFEKTLAELGVERGKMLTVRDEDEKFRPVHFCLAAIKEGDEVSEEGWVLTKSPPSIPLQPPKPVEKEDSPDEIEALDSAPEPPSVAVSSKKRVAPQDGDENEDTPVKKARPSANGSEVIEIE